MFCIRLYQEVCLRLLGLRKVEEMNELKNVHMLCVMHSSVLLLYLDSTVLYYYCGTIVVHVHCCGSCVVLTDDKSRMLKCRKIIIKQQLQLLNTDSVLMHQYTVCIYI